MSRYRCSQAARQRRQHSRVDCQWADRVFTPLPEDASPRTQADAHASLLDALKIDRTIVIGASAGAPSAMQFAIRYPERCSALVLLVPLTWKPKDVPDSAPRPSRVAELILRSIVGSDAVFWLALHLRRSALVEKVLGTPPAVLVDANPSEQARVDEVLWVGHHGEVLDEIASFT